MAVAITPLMAPFAMALIIKRLGNEPPCGSYHLHGFYQKAIAKHGEADGIIDQNDHHHGDQDTPRYHRHDPNVLKFSSLNSRLRWENALHRR